MRNPSLAAIGVCLLAAATQFQKDNPGKTLICNQGFTSNGDGDAYHVAPVFFGEGVPSYVDENGKAFLNTPEAIKAYQEVAANRAGSRAAFDSRTSRCLKRA